MFVYPSFEYLSISATDHNRANSCPCDEGIDPHAIAVDHLKQTPGEPVARDAQAGERVSSLVPIVPT